MELNIKSKIALYLVSCIAVVFLFPFITQFPYGFMDDDSFVYTQVSYNDATIGISSFDGVEKIDGYHQLWAFLLTTLSRITSFFSLEKNIHLTVYLLFYWTLLYGCVLRHSKTLIQAIVLFSLAIISAFLMETLLLAFILIELMLIAERCEDKPETTPWTFYLLIACVPMTRIDSSIIVASLSLSYLFRRQITQVVKVWVALAVGLGIHFAMQYSAAGSFYSASSFVKKSNANLFGTSHLWRNLTQDPGCTFRTGTFLTLAVMLLYLYLKHKKVFYKSTSFFVCLGAIAFTIIHLHANYLRNWYILPGVLVTAVAIMKFKDEEDQGIAQLKKCFVFILFTMVVGFFPYKIYQCYQYGDEAKRVSDFIAYVDDVVPQSERIYQIDGSGFMGWKLGRIVNGDGLFNTHAYANRLIAGELENYMKEKDIKYYINNVENPEDYLIDYGGQQIPYETSELLKSIAQDDSHFYSRFRLYRINHKD